MEFALLIADCVVTVDFDYVTLFVVRLLLRCYDLLRLRVVYPFYALRCVPVCVGPLLLRTLRLRYVGAVTLRLILHALFPFYGCCLHFV